MTITANAVKDLRDATGLPMMKCKEALAATNGDVNAAIEWLRKQGLAAAGKKAGRATNAGYIATAQSAGVAVAVLVGSETDFVSGNEIFRGFANELAQTALSSGASSAEELAAKPFQGATVTEAVAAMIQKIGENIAIVTVSRLTGPEVVAYNHGGRVAALVAGSGNAAALRTAAMHTAAASPAPVSLDRASVDPELVAKEREIIAATPDVAAKPEAMRGKIVDGKMGRFYKENVLLEQELLVDGDDGKTVGAYLTEKGAVAQAFVRLAIGG
jgi:elongation factor Ts